MSESSSTIQPSGQAQPVARWQRFNARIASSRPGAWFLSISLHRADMLLLRLTSGRVSLTQSLSGLPVLVLSHTGANSGRIRAVPLLYFRDDQRIILIASNWGRASHPAWYYNLRAVPRAALSGIGLQGNYTAREATGAERETYWRTAVALYAGYAAYKRRAHPRRIPIVVLSPEIRS